MHRLSSRGQAKHAPPFSSWFQQPATASRRDFAILKNRFASPDGAADAAAERFAHVWAEGMPLE
jgi:hypothetical protein